MPCKKVKAAYKKALSIATKQQKGGSMMSDRIGEGYK